MNLLKDRKVLLIVIIGILARLLISATTFHSDVRVLNSVGSLIGQQGIFNPYEYVKNLPSDNPYQIDFPFDDLPLVYYLFGIYHFLFSPFFNQEFQIQFLGNTQSTLGSLQLLWHLILIKFPLLIFDLALAYLLTRFFVDEKRKKLVLIFWLFNPVTLFATSAMGTFDIIPTFFVLFALYLLLQKRLTFAALTLGIGGATKFFPFLLAPIFILSIAKNWQERIKFFVLIILPYLATVLPYLPSAVFRQTALFAPQIEKTFFAQIPLSGGEAVIIVAFLLFIFYFFAKKQEITEQNGWLFFLIPQLATLSFTHYHPQWFLWLTPLFILGLIKNNFQNLGLILIMFTTFVILTLLFEPSLSTRLFAPLVPGLFQAAGLSDFLSRFAIVDIFNIKSIFQTIFAAASAWYIFSHLWQAKTKK